MKCLVLLNISRDFLVIKKNIAIAKYAFKIAARFILTASGNPFFAFSKGISNATKTIVL